jgi:hypothetical protein
MAVALNLDNMSLADKLETMETLWEDLRRHAEGMVVPEWHQEVLAAREADLRDGKDGFIDWEIAKIELRNATR